MWTHFMDMYSGGSKKEKWGHIYIEAPEIEASIIFYNRFGHNPFRVSCTCCGPDYALHEYDSLDQATAYERCCEFDDEKNCWIERPSTSRWDVGKYRTLEEFKLDPTILILPASEIKPSEKEGSLPRQGYVWID